MKRKKTASKFGEVFFIGKEKEEKGKEKEGERENRRGSWIGEKPHNSKDEEEEDYF